MFKAHHHVDSTTYQFFGRNICYRKDYHGGKLRTYIIMFKLFTRNYTITISVADF